MKKILYITDVYFDAKGRAYYEEDLYITNILKEKFDVALCHPKNSEGFEQSADLIVFRNAGAVSAFREVYDNFKRRVLDNNLNTFNDFVGKADMCGKAYMLEMFKESLPIIPTVDCLSDIKLLPICDKYVIKPIDGADSIGLEILEREELLNREIPDGEMIIQPAIDFQYELSFYFINDEFQYAMYAPDKTKRWDLKQYEPSSEELAFAQKFIEWNDIEMGIQRVDACKTQDGKLLLMELEDLNPYLSLLDLDEDTRSVFMQNFMKALDQAIER